MIKKIFISFAFSTATCLITCYGQKNIRKEIDSLVALIPSAKNDTAKLKLYDAILYRYEVSDAQEGFKFEKEAMAVAQKLNWDMGTAYVISRIGRLYWKLGKTNEALKHHFEALRIYRKHDDESKTAKLLSYIGQDYADGGNYADANKYLTEALEKQLALGDSEAIELSYSLLSWVAGQQGNYSESSKYNMLAIKICEKRGDDYNLAIYLTNLADDYKSLENYDQALKYQILAVESIKKADDMINLSGTYSSIADGYLLTGKTEEALKYCVAAIETGKIINDRIAIANGYQQMGDIYMKQPDYNKAISCYLEAVENYKAVNEKNLLASACISTGICYIRIGQTTDAKVFFKEAIALAKELDSKSLFESYYRGVELFDSASGNWQSAYKNYKRYITLHDSLQSQKSTKLIMRNAMQYEYDKKEAAAKAEQEKKDIRQRTIRNSIGGVLAGSLIFLVVVYRQRNKIAKARKRSDELLLNILPREVAEELKTKGKAEAKQIDSVTVLFTDFKGFTQLSEKMSPKELVTEIDTCFRAFDNIIHRYKVEKIKTIGDSYMCAGGLPLPNQTHANDVVSAALEIQHYMQQHKAERESAGKLFFEIRIGIHSGPVVAGIVGVKKYSYDIWGDTVNTASRMESSGEIGKVNISESTYELVKENFECEFRGEVNAKGKGSVKMYFVESIRNKNTIEKK